jgi:hypothetical protein
MNKVTLAFVSIFHLWRFKKQANVSNADVKMNLLTGSFSQEQIQLAQTLYRARVQPCDRVVEILN